MESSSDNESERFSENAELNCSAVPSLDGIVEIEGTDNESIYENFGIDIASLSTVSSKSEDEMFSENDVLNCSTISSFDETIEMESMSVADNESIPENYEIGIANSSSLNSETETEPSSCDHSELNYSSIPSSDELTDEEEDIYVSETESIYEDCEMNNTDSLNSENETELNSSEGSDLSCSAIPSLDASSETENMFLSEIESLHSGSIFEDFGMDLEYSPSLNDENETDSASYFDRRRQTSSPCSSFSIPRSLSLSSIESNNEDDINSDHERDFLYHPIYENADVCLGDALLKILKVYVTNRLAKKALGDILDTIDYLLPDDNNIPKSKYKLLMFIDKVLPQGSKDFTTKHRICSKCSKYLGKWITEPPIVKCTRCNSTKINSFFLQHSIKSVLQSAFEVRQLYALIDEYKNECLERDPDLLYDLTSGTECKRLKSTIIPGDYDVILMWFTDGVQVSKSGKSHIWPIYGQIVNIHPRYRRGFQFVCGIYYCNRDNKKPDMNSYLEPFAFELEDLYRSGFEWHHPTLNRTMVSRVWAPVASLDAPAKASVQNTMQYNGEYGCSNCEASGESCETGDGTNWVFPISDENPPIRTAERMEIQTEIVKKYDKLKHFKGVKGESIVTKIPHFDRAKGFVPDYLHAILLGVMLMLLDLWCNTKNHKKSYYLKTNVRKEINTFLQKIFPPDNITRTPRKLSNVKQWKASEFRAFLLFYGPILLKNRLSRVYYEHFLLLSRAIHILLQEKISSLELDLAETLLNLFVTDMEEHYGRNKCSYNVHQLLHLVPYTRMWGPLWVWSAFSSEDHNGELLRMAHGSNKIEVELSNTIKIINAYQALQYLMNQKVGRNRHHGLTPCGQPIHYKLTKDDFNALQIEILITKEELQKKKIVVYDRCKVNNDIFTSDLYKRQIVRLNSCVKWKDGFTVMVGYIKFFVTVDSSMFAVIRQLVFSNDEREKIEVRSMEINFDSVIESVRQSHYLHAVPVKKIESKVLRVENYVCFLPNDTERK